MRLIVTALIFSMCATSAIAGWKEQIFVDQITDRKIVRMENASLTPVHLHHRTIVPKLELQCITPSDGSRPYVGAFIAFSEAVAVSDTRMRYRFDDGTTFNELAGISRRGDHFQMPGYGPEEAFVTQIKASSRLRVDLPLPAGNAFMEFNLKGANDALERVRCR